MGSRFAAFAAVSFAFFLACGNSDDAIPGPDDGTFGDGGGTGNGDGSTTNPGKDGGQPNEDGGQPAGPFCASQNPTTQICEDWDDGTVPAQSTPQLDQGASCAIDGAQFLSSPSSYKCSSPGKSGGFTNALLGISTQAPASAKKRTIGFAFRAEQALPTTGDLVIARTFVSNKRSITIELSSELGAVVREQSLNGNGAQDLGHVTISAKPAQGTWTRYLLAIDLDAKTATLTANGASVASLALNGGDDGLFALNLGLQSSAAFTAYYDDVTIDWN